jgi:hypothetical protein
VRLAFYTVGFMCGATLVELRRWASGELPSGADVVTGLVFFGLAIVYVAVQMRKGKP